MTNQLLVSVRSADECNAVGDSAIDIVDIKEPAKGSLGAPREQTVAAVVRALQGKRSVSVALGEMLELDRIGHPRSAFNYWQGINYAKLGLAGCAQQADWPVRLADIWAAWPRTVHPVAVAYADCSRAQAPGWTEVLRVAKRHGSRVLLIDTFDKSSGSLFDWYDVRQLLQINQTVRAAGLRLALAGSLTTAHVQTLACQVRPDVIAVRSAACRSGRTGQVHPESIQQLEKAVGKRQDSRIETLG